MGNQEHVARAASDAGLEIEVRAFPQGTRTAEDAAAAIGCDVAQIVKSPLVVVHGEPVVARAGGADRLEERKLAAAAGGETVRRASAGEARDATGFAVGGVPPLGHAEPLRCFLDDALLDHEVIWAAAGTPTHVFASAPGEL